MSKFRKTNVEVDEIGAAAAALRRDCDGGGGDEDAIERRMGEAKMLESRMNVVMDAVNELVIVANETDPDKVVFGEGMVKKVKALALRVDELSPTVNSVVEIAIGAFEPIRIRRAKAIEDAADAKRLKSETAEREREEAEAAERELKAKRAMEEEAKAKVARARDAVLEKEQREKFEADRKVRREQQAVDASRQAFLAERRERAKTMELSEVLDIIESNCSAKDFRRCVFALKDLVDNVKSSPDDPTFRQMKKSNEMLQTNIISLDGGIEALLCIGFHEVERVTSPNNSEVCYVMEEPSLDQFDAWSAWYATLERNQALLESTCAGIS